MRVRLLYITARKSGAKAQREEVIETDALTVGRGTDSAVHIPGLTVSYHHAAFVAGPGGIFVDRRDAAAIDVNGQLESRVEVRPGDTVRVGTYELRVVEPKDGEQLVLEIEEVAREGSERDEFARNTRIGIERGIFSRRLLSWLVTAGMATLLIVLPLYLRASGRDREATAMGRFLERRLSVGPVSGPHAALPCAACHAERAASHEVSDSTCLSAGCHGNVAAHVVPNAISAGVVSGSSRGATVWRALANSPDAECQHCHLEHRGSDALMQKGDRFCLSCHAGMRTKLGPSAGDAQFEDFGKCDDGPASFACGHPQFRPSILEGVGPDGSATFRRAAIGSSEAIEPGSGLQFSHEVHLKPDLRGFEEGQHVQLECSTCHALSPDGDTMTKVSFARDCEPCHVHKLRLAEVTGEREMPHVAPELVRQALVEFYSDLVLKGRTEDPLIGDSGFRRPGAIGATQRCVGDQRQVAECQANQAIELWFRDEEPDKKMGPCFSCHVRAGGPGDIRVKEVLLLPLGRRRGPEPTRGSERPLDAECARNRFTAGERWLPFAKFSHVAHSSLRYPDPPQAELTCESCHEARKANEARIVLLPSIEECRKCHGGESPPPNRVASRCLMCHEFHHAEFGPMRCERPPADNPATTALRALPASAEHAS